MNVILKTICTNFCFLILRKGKNPLCLIIPTWGTSVSHLRTTLDCGGQYLKRFFLCHLTSSETLVLGRSLSTSNLFRRFLDMPGGMINAGGCLALRVEWGRSPSSPFSSFLSSLVWKINKFAVWKRCQVIRQDGTSRGNNSHHKNAVTLKIS